MRKSLVAALLASAAMFASVPAYAQDSAAADAQETVGIADIVVTAQRREEALQNVPVAVTALSSDALDQMRVTNVKNLAGVAPNLQINTQGLQSNPTIIIRGIASGTSNNAVDPKVGIYLDGVYIGRTVGSVFDLADIERVEVLRGPQGTLFGRNATSGAISLVTAAPSGEWGMKATGSYGNYDAWRGKITLDLPALGPLSVKVAYLHDQIEGDQTNLIGGRTLDLSVRDPRFGNLRYSNKLGGRNIDGGQLAARLDASDDFRIDYRFDYTDARAVGRGVQSLGVIPDASGQLLQPIVNLQGLLGGITNESTKRIDNLANATSLEHVVTQGHSLTLNWDVSDALTVKSITAYRKFKQDPYVYDLAASGGLKFTVGQLRSLLLDGGTTLFDPANLPGPNDSFFSLLTARATKQKQFTQEVQFQYTQDRWELTAGVFYFHENSPATDILGILQPVANGKVVGDQAILTAFPVGTPLAPFGIDINGDGVLDARDVNSFDALFGSGTTDTRAINDSMAIYGQATWHVTDKFDLTGGLRYTLDDRQTNIYSIAGGQGGQLGPGKYKAHFDKINFTAIATYRPTDDVTAYGKVSSGYVAGGILSGIPYKPESLIAYELGLKTKFWDNRVRANFAAFYSDYKDLQTQNFIDGVQFFDNAGKAHIKGFEAEVDVVPVRGLTLSGNLGYQDFNYKEFILAGVDVSDVARTTYSSKWTGRISGQYDAPEFSNGGNAFVRLEGRYKSKAPLVSTPITDLAGNVSPLEQYAYTKAYWLVDGRLGVANLPLGGVDASISVYGQNLFDVDYNPFGAPVLSLTTTYDRGRTYGVELGIKF
ncbi:MULTISPECIES: TonB-dependent receptor [Sphingomonadales]|uniref:TonB-dependent receptor n=2 Tax=Edaphosphingomonas TaxID=3423724 RepID=A0A2T4I509_9SPHN|nr:MULTISPECIES: TonB-dependent receptor [Sphingomonas]AGH48807.1 TonB-dependent receptor, plug [Sphingomonas sp. MM-1]OHT21232.1 Pesticin receptor precursor [Sphingomonas haloaromaticamans]PTD24964.1 TonB-dependent receptor [Sphingomonas fennica]